MTRKPSSDVSQAAAEYLASLKDCGHHYQAEITTVKPKRAGNLIDINHAESASSFLKKILLEKSSIARDAVREERIDIEAEAKYTLLHGSKHFNGFLSTGRPVFGPDAHLAAVFDDSQVNAVQKKLQELGYETERRLALIAKAAAF